MVRDRGRGVRILLRAASLLAVLAACDSASGGAAGPDVSDIADVAGVATDAAGPVDGAASADGTAGHASDAGVDPASFEPEIDRIASYLASPALGGRNEGTPGGRAAREFLVDEWTRCGVVPVAGATASRDGFEQPVTTGDGINLVGRIEGTDPTLRDRHVLVSAHYDHLGTDERGVVFSGAYDNAVAVAMVVEVACRLAEDPPARSVLVAHWDAEEPPTVRTDRMGSAFYVAHPLVPLEDTDVAIVLDLTGAGLWPGYDGHVALGAETSPEVTAAAAATAAPEGLTLLRGGLHLAEEQITGHHAWSDYDAFRNATVPVLFLSDGQTRVYHTPDDTMERVDLPKAGREAALLLRLTDRLANAAATPTWAPQEDYARDAETTVALLTAALAAGGAVDALAIPGETRAKLEDDRAAAAGVQERLATGTTATDDDIAALRRGVQRVMCVCSPLPQVICGAL